MCPETENLITAVEQAADGVLITDTSGKIQYVNPAFTAMTGYTSDEAVGQHPRMLKSGRQNPDFYKELWSTIGSGKTWHGELTNRRKDGSTYTEEMRITPVRGSNGEVSSYIAIKHDVTEERADSEARGFLAAIVESSDDAIIAFTTAGIIAAWNRAAETLFGYAAGEAIGKHLSMMLAPERVPLLPRFIQRVLEGSAIPQYESVCMHREGRRVEVAVTGSAIRNPAGEALAISVILRDITERREAERTRALLASIIESSDDAILSATPEGAILSWNGSAERLFGYSEAEITGRNVEILAAPDRLEALRRNRAAICGGSASRK